MINKKINYGFTLIELLAVIVILAVIAVIATPIVLNIIDESRMSSKIRAAENYLDAVELAIVEANVEYGGEFYPKACLINEKGNLLCDGSSDEIIVEMDGEKPTSGEIIFQNKEIKTVDLVFYDIGIYTNENGELAYDGTTNKGVLEVNGVKYSTKEFVDAIENSSATNPAKLIDNITIENRYTFVSDKEMYLDLNGKTITVKKSGDIILKGINSELTVKNGKIIAEGNSSALTVGQDLEDVSAVNKRHLIIEEDVIITAENYGVAGFGKAKIDFYGTITLTESGFGLSGNGNAANKYTEFNIYDGSTITAKNGVALYLPQYGTTNIYEGAKLEGDTVIGIKSGTLNIMGGNFNAIGSKKEPVARPNATQNGGLNTTGDTILIEEQEKYAGEIVVNITGGTFTSKNGYIIQENNTTGRTVTVTGLYSTKKAVPNTTNRFYYTN